MLVKQYAEQKSEGCDLGGAVEPEKVFPLRNGGDHVVELLREGTSGSSRHGDDQCRIRRDSGRLKQGSQKGVFVFAVPILVGQDVGGGMGLIAAHAESYADVAKLGADVVVDGAHLGVVIRCCFVSSAAFARISGVGLTRSC